MMNIFNKNSKAFTIIELIVVIAILGVLVLLAGPKFLGYVEKAELARIQHDVKVAEGVVGEHLVKEGSLPDIWEDSNLKNSTNSIYDKTGLVTLDEVQDKDYKIVPKEEVSSKLPGSFHANKGGKVYYVGANPEQPEDNGANPEQPEDNNDKGLMNPIKSREPEGKEIPINSADKLAKIGKTEEYPLNGKYILTANIDLSVYSEGEGWTPIGTSTSKFTGSFDGNGYNITGLKINSPATDYIGLFGYTQGAIIKNVALEDINVTGRDRTGGLAGVANGSTITNSYATGSVKGTGDNTGGLVGSVSRSTVTASYATGEVRGTSYTGGLVGSAGSLTKIENSYATGSVTGTGSTGGLVGYAQSLTVTNSYAIGSVTGRSETGGLVGYAVRSTVTDSYATGSVSGTGATGGLVGYAWGGNTISNSYATGSVSGGVNTGGLVGAGGSSTITNSYWDRETTGQSSSAGSGTGKSTEDMKEKDTYTDWDFDKIWQINEGESYPTLR